MGTTKNCTLILRFLQRWQRLVRGMPGMSNAAMLVILTKNNKIKQEVGSDHNVTFSIQGYSWAA